MDLFEQRRGAEQAPQPGPLAARMRPMDLSDIVGQDHLLGPGKLLRRAIEADRLTSIVLYGPPGCGKTSLAEVIAHTTRRRFVRTSGVTANVAALKGLISEAGTFRRMQGVETTLFIDEIHRFNKAQQDVLLPYLEDGTVVLIGATTHNPAFFLNSPLVSRSLVFELRPLNEAAVADLLGRAIAKGGLRRDAVGVIADAEALAHLGCICEGDGRRALNALELAALSTEPGADGIVRLRVQDVEESVQKRMVVYDRNEDGHYDTISAFIKSLRGSDVDSAVYWLAKMLHAGEDPRFIARRLVILASEDIGNADPRALTLAVSAMMAADFVGMPEARIILAQAVTYLATAPKSNASYVAIDRALDDVQNNRAIPVPEHLKNVHVKRAGEPARDEKYQYPHDFEGRIVAQEYGAGAAGYYVPVDSGYEETIARRMARWRAAVSEAGRTAAVSLAVRGGEG